VWTLTDVYDELRTRPGQQQTGQGDQARRGKAWCVIWRALAPTCAASPRRRGCAPMSRFLGAFITYTLQRLRPSPCP
jgi:hypothetical protein